MPRVDATLSTVWFDCGHCHRKSIGTIRAKPLTKPNTATITCTHQDCGKESLWSLKAPRRYEPRGQLTEAQRTKLGMSSQ